MSKWKQREAHVPLGDSDTTEYRYCLDALLATIEDMRRFRRETGVEYMPFTGSVLGLELARAEERAADLAHRLFVRWIEVTE